MRQYQDWLCHRLKDADGSKTSFTREENAPDNEHGCTRVIEHGAVLEKGSVVVKVSRDPRWQLPSPPNAPPCPGRVALSLSAVQHPRSPWVPISHLSLRYEEDLNGHAWFAGGLDLTPIYVDEGQARWFHQQLADMCQRHDSSYYQRFKQRADEYFYLPHRRETRGVGGLVFDRLVVGRDGLFEELFAFVQDVGEVYGRTYGALMRENAVLPYSQREQQWQQVRRGRYAEFNLLMEREFWAVKSMGLADTLGLGLPPQAGWPHVAPEPGSPEATTQRWLRQGVNWLPAA